MPQRETGFSGPCGCPPPGLATAHPRGHASVVTGCGWGTEATSHPQWPRGLRRWAGRIIRGEGGHGNPSNEFLVKRLPKGLRKGGPPKKAGNPVQTRALNQAGEVPSGLPPPYLEAVMHNAVFCWPTWRPSGLASTRGHCKTGITCGSRLLASRWSKGLEAGS